MTREEFIEQGFLRPDLLVTTYEPQDYDICTDGDMWIQIENGKLINSQEATLNNRFSNLGPTWHKARLKEFAYERCAIAYLGKVYDMIHGDK